MCVRLLFVSNETSALILVGPKGMTQVGCDWLGHRSDNIA